jgi:hypothetical protein
VHTGLKPKDFHANARAAVGNREGVPSAEAEYYEVALDQAENSRMLIVSILCPTAFNALPFLKLCQRLRRAIRAGDILAKLLSELHVRRFCSHFCELTLNQ